MRNKLLIVALVACLVPGCTVVGGITGGAVAGVHNSHRGNAIARGETPEAEYSVGNSVVAGAAIGLVLDVAAIALASYALSNIQFGYCTDGCPGY
jgi:hypothetical protein